MSAIQSLSVHTLQQWQQEQRRFILLDVREDDEVAFCRLPGSLHLPMHLVPLRHNELPDDQAIVVYCHHGIRSLQVARFLEHAGFDELYNLSGGIDAWSQLIDPELPRY
ncbi:rhodanese-like domain-containing protein [Neisseria shayeganii]|uniref:Sulfurtransferase n=1 Tax=Neisseria shayeganii TaxID=607712 RepID=A0A7D7SIR9_9NEIS|nr:rhodanese-like domain-containing protein [Neisseria shayeganii]QMT40927.1 sulfurtransferase [Neisseria shayeganii]